MRRREPVVLAGVIIILLQWIVRWAGAEWDPSYDAPIQTIAEVLVVVAGLWWARRNVMPVRTLEAAGMNVSNIKTRAQRRKLL
jgi:hypothetical protein